MKALQKESLLVYMGYFRYSFFDLESMQIQKILIF